MSEKINVLGVAFDNLTMDEALEAAYAVQAEHRGAYVVTPNPEIVMICRENEAAAAAVRAAELTIADGIGVIYGAKLLKTPLKQKLPGIDFSERLLAKMEQDGRSVFLFGGKPGVAEAAREKLQEKYPGVKFLGVNDGYFTDDAPIVEKINAAAPDLLMVCLGAPKQELWMHRHAAELNVGLMIGGGGSLDVFAGVVERAPEGWQKAGLEWLYRLLKDPKRIGRMMNLPKFMLKIIFMRKK